MKRVLLLSMTLGVGLLLVAKVAALRLILNSDVSELARIDELILVLNLGVLLLVLILGLLLSILKRPGPPGLSEKVEEYSRTGKLARRLRDRKEESTE